MKRFLLFGGLFLIFAAISLSAQEAGTVQEPGTAQEPAASPAQGAGAAWSKTITPKAEDTLVIYVDPGNLQIVPWDKKEIAITTEGIDKTDQAKILVASKNKDVRLDFRGDKAGNGTFLIQIPATLNIDSYTSGNVEAKGALNGRIKFKTNAGSVTLADVKGNLNIDSASGDIYVGVIAGDATISTNGDIETQEISGNAELKNQSGDSFVKSVGGNLGARVADGDLSVGDIGGNLTAQSTIGDIDFRKVGGMSNVNTGSGDIDFFEGTGMIIAQSDSGDIYLRKVTGAVDARTEDGDISAEMFSGSGGASKFFSRDGDVEVFFADGSKATVEAKVTGQEVDEDDEPLTSDFPPVSDKSKLAAKYEINGGGDSVVVESVNGDVYVKKLAAKPQPRPAANKPNQK